MSDVFLDEYSADDALKRYRAESAGYGVSYLLEHDYGDIYRDVLANKLPASARQRGLSMIEFGCGAGMNLIHVAAMAEKMGLPIERAIGADFSDRLIDAARADASRVLTPATMKKMQFVRARNENLSEDIATALDVPVASLLGTFHFVFGVNTFRYCHRANKELEGGQELYKLLAPGGICVNIDMNAQFPFFRSQMRREERGQIQDKQFYIPVLEEYVRPFKSAGFQIQTAKNFCWIPHSASKGLATVGTMLTPVLNIFLPRYALRSLVIAKKPA